MNIIIYRSSPVYTRTFVKYSSDIIPVRQNKLNGNDYLIFFPARARLSSSRCSDMRKTVSEKTLPKKKIKLIET